MIGVVASATIIGDMVATRLAGLGESLDLRRIERELARAADPKNDFTPEQQERLAVYLRALVKRLQPLATELAPLFCGPESRRG
ncbi:MAG: hypothetical protein FJX46_08415 [Alphaproteobacteria bacterium]|nr:hypothetical protein [Alphaproteobacteria bacterium]